MQAPTTTFGPLALGAQFNLNESFRFQGKPCVYEKIGINHAVWIENRAEPFVVPYNAQVSPL